MTPRPRKPKNRNLPPNLYTNNGGRTYLYRRPDNGKTFGMGSDRKEAIEAAKQLNSMLMSSSLVSKVMGAETVTKHIEHFLKRLDEREYSKSTESLTKIRLKQIREAIGDMALEDVTVKHVSDMLELYSPGVANQLRSVCIDLFRSAMARGLCHANPAEVTEIRRVKKSRKRMTLEQFNAIRERAPAWLQNAMDLALITLQRREDITLLKFDQIRDRYLYVIQQKTRKHDTGYLKIAIGPSLEKIISRCRDDIASPFLVHRRPQKKVKREGMEHWTQIKPEMISRQVKKITDELLEDMPEAERPTFHEIRALGIKLYKDAGIDPQKLAGHASEKMTKNYDSDHSEIRWVETEAGLKL